MSQIPFRQQLEKHNQPEEVRQRLAAGQYNPPNDTIAQEYLDSVDRKEAAKAAALRDAREERTLAIAEDALSIARDSAKSARRNARWAMYAAIIAAIAAVIATKDQIIALIFGNP